MDEMGFRDNADEILH